MRAEQQVVRAQRRIEIPIAVRTHRIFEQMLLVDCPSDPDHRYSAKRFGSNGFNSSGAASPQTMWLTSWPGAADIVTPSIAWAGALTRVFTRRGRPPQGFARATAGRAAAGRRKSSGPSRTTPR